MNRIAKFLSAYATERARKRKQERAYADYMIALDAFDGKQIDWNARLEADRRMRERFIGKPFAKRRAAALKGARA